MLVLLPFAPVALRRSEAGGGQDPVGVSVRNSDPLALVKKKWTQAERLLATPLICSAQWPEALASSTSPCIGRG